MATGNTATSPVELPYVGTVVETAAATSLKKDFLMPLRPKIKDGCIEGPELYLDGHSWVNPKRSTFCPAFAVPPLPKQAVDESFVSGDGPEAKKRKTLSGLNYTPAASVAVAWRELIVSVPDGDGVLKFAYGRPVLENTAAYNLSPVALGKPLHRMREVLDDIEVEKKPKKETVVKKNFALW